MVLAPGAKNILLLLWCSLHEIPALQLSWDFRGMPTYFMGFKDRTAPSMSFLQRPLVRLRKYAWPRIRHRAVNPNDYPVDREDSNQLRGNRALDRCKHFFCSHSGLDGTVALSQCEPSSADSDCLGIWRCFARGSCGPGILHSFDRQQCHWRCSLDLLDISGRGRAFMAWLYAGRSIRGAQISNAPSPSLRCLGDFKTDSWEVQDSPGKVLGIQSRLALSGRHPSGNSCRHWSMPLRW